MRWITGTRSNRRERSGNLQLQHWQAIPSVSISIEAPTKMFEDRLSDGPQH